ncbi:PAS domain S-box-containing protein [Halovenus aranensis]|uniref:histidine kinase n=1 Tax=Halovenus aranensis TaxID=890420 RepID=A0A1G8WZE8_9EURY|nr:PAS domain S-box protein [Halovenus aranensis]SDJ83591.1 PAS domain S-box-containing protein [Halovenus aranensis]
MSLTEKVPDVLRSRYAFKLFAIAVLIVAVIGTVGTVMALQVSDQVTDQQLQSLENNAELEADQLARWFDGEQESIRVLSAHQGIDLDDPTLTRETLYSELEQRSEEVVSFHIAERARTQPSNGTTEPVVVSTNQTLEGDPLTATNIDWGEDTDGEEIQYAFESVNDILVSWVYLDSGNMSVAIASPTPDGEHVLIGEYEPSVRIGESTHVIEGTETVVLGGVSAYVMFEANSPNEFRPYKGQQNRTEVGSQILAREDQFAPLNGSEIADDEVRGYHSVPGEGVNWVVVKEAPRANALALTDRVQTDLTVLVGTMFLGFLLVGAVIQYGPIRSIKRLAGQADAIAEGDLSVDIEETGRIDEVGRLRRSFRNTKRYIETITRQSEALSRQEFDADVLDEEIPGRVGEAMAAMQTDLERFITEIERERERYTTLVEQSSDGVVVVQDGRCVFANDQFAEITGYDHDTLVESRLIDLVVPGDRDRVSERYDRRLEDAAPTQFEADIETRDGTRRTVELSMARIERDGEPAVLVNIRDVTERKHREQRLEVFNRVLRHNIRNQADVVKSHAEVLSDRSADQHVSQILDSADRLSVIGNRARTIDRIISREVQPSTVDLTELFGRVQAGAEPRRESVTVTTRVTGVNSLVTDEWILEAILESLVANSLRYAESTVTITAEQTAEGCVLTVEDDGPGIPPDEIAALDAGTETTLQHSRGLLGLWQLKWGVEKLAGTLTFDTAEGTTVRVVLPDWGGNDGDI